jgi:hypothetical protein
VAEGWIASLRSLSGLRHFQTPIVAGNHLYVGADDRLYAFHF